MDAIGEVRRLSAGWRHLPPVHVVESASRLPVSAPDDVVGLYYHGEIYVVDGPSVAPVWGHEAIAHHGLRALYGKSRWCGLMRAVQAGIRAGDPLLTALRSHVRSVYRDENGSNYLTSYTEADEVAARLAEMRMNAESGLYETEGGLRKRLLAVAGEIGRDSLYMDLPVNGDQLDGALLSAQEYLRNGRPFGPFGELVYPAAVNKPMGPRIPARSVEESDRMIRADRERARDKIVWRDAVSLWLCGLGLAAFMTYMAYLAFGAAIGYSGPIVGSVLAAGFVWLLWFRKS